MITAFIMLAMLSVPPPPVAELRLLPHPAPSSATVTGVEESSACLALSIGGGFRLDSQTWFLHGAMVSAERTVRSLLLVTQDQGHVFSEALRPVSESYVGGLYRASAKTTVAVVVGPRKVDLFAGSREPLTWSPLSSIAKRDPSGWVLTVRLHENKGGLWLSYGDSPRHERFETQNGGATWAKVKSSDRYPLSRTERPEPSLYRVSPNVAGTIHVEELLNPDSRPLRYALVARLPRFARVTTQGTVEPCPP